MITLKKRLLAKVPIQEATDGYISLARRIKKEKYLVSAEIAEVEEKKILLLYFYNQPELKEGNTKAAFRVFLSIDDYITQDLSTTTIKWRTGSISSLIGGYYYMRWDEECVLVDDKSSGTIKKFLNAKEDPLLKIDELQQNIMAKRLDKKHQKIKDRIDKQMEKVPKLPWGFKRWIDNTALFHSRYIYYQYKARKKLDGYCTHCKSDVVIESPRHNEKGICPNCKSPITYKAMGKSRKVEDIGQAALIQKVDDGIVVRYFSIYKEYYDHYKEPYLSYIELSRDFYDSKGKVKSYEWLNFKQTGQWRWCDGQGRFGFRGAVLYDKNLDETLKENMWKYSAIKEFATHREGFGFSIYSYLENYKEYPSIEYLVKLRLYKLVDDIITRWGTGRDINLEGKSLKEVLGINKNQLMIAQRIDAGVSELHVIREAEKANLNLTDEQILFIAEHLNIERVIEMSKYTTVHKIIKYIKSHTSKEKKEDSVYRDWMDYIRFCDELGYDLMNEFILYPKNLMQEHDRLMELVSAKRDKERAKKLEIQKKKIESMAKELTYKYGMEYKGLVIMAPKDATEITKEGQVLHHCVGTYIGRIADGESVVLFIRNKKALNDPYCTLEVIDGKIIQCRGKYNEDMREELKSLLNRFEKLKLSHDVKGEAV